MKLIRTIIFLKLTILLTFVGLNVLGQDIPIRKNQEVSANKNPADTSKKTGSDISDKVKYKAKNSIVNHVQREEILLYKEARFIYEDFQLDADYIRYDKKNNILFASGVYDSLSKKYVGRPILKSGTDATVIADSLIYNLETTRARIWNPYTEQEGGFFSGGVSKKQIDDEIHAKDVYYSTCNLPYPHQHFGFHISKGIVTEQHIVSGPVNLEIENVPTPLVLPFGFFPKPNKRSSGILFPTFGEDATRGFFAQNFGYYLGLSDYWDAKLLGSIYTNGSFEGSVNANYTKRYKHNGALNFFYARTINGLEGTPEYENPNKDFKLTWMHSQNANARPGTTFSASVNLGTSSYYRNTGANGTYDLNQIANNTMQSSIAYSKVLADGLFNFSTAISHSQTLSTRDISVQLPSFNLNMSTINPFDSKKRVGEQKWYQRLSVGYSLQGNNSISTKDSLLFQPDGLKRLRTGFQHSIPLSLGFNLLKHFNFTMGGNYTEVWNFQSSQRRYTRFSDGSLSYRADTLHGFKRGGSYNLSTSLSTKIYGQRNFGDKGRIKAMRHVMTPNVSFSYNPDFTKPGNGPYEYALDQNGDRIVNRNTTSGYEVYSRFAESMYPGSFSSKSAAIGFGIENNVELKVRSKNDTSEKGDKKIPIIQGLSLNGSYNFVAPTYKLSNINFSGRSQFTDKIGINYYGTLDPYSLRDSLDLSGNLVRKIKEDRYFWQSGKLLPRLASIGFSFDYSFNSEALKRKNDNYNQVKGEAEQRGMTPEQSERLARISRDPNAFVDFNVPWNFAFSYSFNYSNDGNNKVVTNSLNFNGDFNLTPKWKVQFNSGYDFERKGLTPMNVAIYRDLHCWDMSVNWVPYGAYRSYSINIRVKSSILQDLKLSKRQGYYTRF